MQSMPPRVGASSRLRPRPCRAGGLGPLLRLVPARKRPPMAVTRSRRRPRCCASGSKGGYRSLVSAWDDPEAIVPGASEPQGRDLRSRSLPSALPDGLDRMQYLDTLTYLPDDILTKVDRASMAVALEVRVPILDHRVVEFSWSFRRASRCGAARANGCCGNCSIGTCRRPCWTGRKAASPCRSTRGCGGRYGIGPRSSCRPAAFGRRWPARRRHRSGPAGRSISTARGTGMPRFGPC